jgi:hypothetical protein
MRVIDLQAPCDLPLRGQEQTFRFCCENTPAFNASGRRAPSDRDAGPPWCKSPMQLLEKRCPGTLRALSPAGRPRSHLGSHARSSRSDWPDPRPLLRSRSPWVKERQDNLAAGGPARSRGAALSGLRPRQRRLGAHGRRGGTRPHAAPPPVCRARASPRACVHRFSTPISTTSAARSSASFPCRRDRRWSRSASWRRVTPASSCSPWTRTHTAPERPRDENQPICDAVESITTDKRQLPLFRRNSCLHRECVRYYQLSDGLTCL